MNTEPNEPMVPERRWLAALNSAYRLNDFQEWVIERVAEWGAVTPDALIDWFHEEEWPIEDLPEGSWIARDLATYQGMTVGQRRSFKASL